MNARGLHMKASESVKVLAKFSQMRKLKICMETLEDQTEKKS